MNANYSANSKEQLQPSKLTLFKNKCLQLLNYPKKVRYSTIRQARKAVKDLFIYLIFLAITTTVTQTTSDHKMYFYAKMLEEQLATRKTVIEPDYISTFTDIRNSQQFWDFMEFTFLPWLERGDFKTKDLAAIYKFQNETKNFAEIFGDMQNRTILHGNVLIGPPRLRQIRVKQDECEYHPVFSKYLPECYASYSWMTEDRREYKGIQWQSMSEADTTPLWGEIELYWSAGYVISFSYNNEDSLRLVKRLRADNWIDQGSSVFLLEFNLYHVDTHLFELVKFLVENPPSGKCVANIKLRTLRRESFFSNSSWLMCIITIGYYVLIVLSSCREIFLIKELGFYGYISFPINLADFLSCLLSYSMLFLNITHFITIERVMRHIKISDRYISLDMCWQLNIIYQYIAGSIIFIAWLRLLHFIAFNRTMIIFVNILYKIKNDIIGFLLILFIVIMAYAQCGMILFGDNDTQFRNLLTFMFTILRWTVRNAKYDKLLNFNQNISWIYYISFIVFGYILLLLPFKAIVINTYDEVKQIVMTRPSQLRTAIRLCLREIYDFLYKLYSGKRKEKTPTDLDAKGDYESDQRIDPQQAAAMAAMRQMEHNNPATLTHPEYLPGRLERAVKRVQVLEEVTNQSLRRLLEYYSLLGRQYNIEEMSVNINGTVEESVL